MLFTIDCAMKEFYSECIIDDFFIHNTSVQVQILYQTIFKLLYFILVNIGAENEFFVK